jgi:hypothetical protein
MKLNFNVLLVGASLIIVLSINELSAQRKLSFVKPYITRKGKFVSGHYRKSYNLKPNAYKSRIRSKVYYHTRGKYLRKFKW